MEGKKKYRVFYEFKLPNGELSTGSRRHEVDKDITNKQVMEIHKKQSPSHKVIRAEEIKIKAKNPLKGWMKRFWKKAMKVISIIYGFLFIIMFISLFGLFGTGELFPYNYYIFGILCIPLIIEGILKRRFEKKELGFIKEVSGKMERFGGKYHYPKRVWLRLFKGSLVLDDGGQLYTFHIRQILNVELVKNTRSFKGQGRTRGATFSSVYDGIKVTYSESSNISDFTIYRGTTTTGFGIRKQEYEEMIELIIKQLDQYQESN